MRGSVKWQVNEIYKRAGMNAIGKSKHHEKIALREQGKRTFSEISRNTGIYSYKTADEYRRVWRQFGEFAKKECKVRDLEKVGAEHIQAFLESKIDQGVARQTYDSYKSALGKFEAALNRLSNGKSYDFTPAFESANELRDELQRFSGSRAYKDPDRLISRIADPMHRLCARLQKEGGCRRDELATIREDRLKGDGQFEVRGKGGKVRVIQVSKEVYRELENLILAGETLRTHEQKTYNEYLASLKEAAAATGQPYTGSHGLRWNFAQERMREIQREGGAYEAGLVQVSREMGHERPEITEHYLR